MSLRHFLENYFRNFDYSSQIYFKYYEKLILKKFLTIYNKKIYVKNKTKIQKKKLLILIHNKSELKIYSTQKKNFFFDLLFFCTN